MVAHYHRHPGIVYSQQRIGSVQQIYLCLQFAWYWHVDQALSNDVQENAYLIWLHSRWKAAPMHIPEENQLTPLWLIQLGWKGYLAGQEP
jgi:hypothetical protein